MSDNLFLKIAKSNWILSNDLAFAILDGYPVSSGHTLVVTKRLVPTWFEATPEEQVALMALVNDVKRHLDSTLKPQPSGYNVGFNSGESAGQTIMHVHVHVIPRYDGDMADPRGGVRHVIPSKGNYLVESRHVSAIPSEVPTSLHLSSGPPNSKLWDHLSDRMVGAHLVDILASFVQQSGLEVIEQRLFSAVKDDAALRILVSDYLYISDPKALWRLLAWQELIGKDADCRGSLSVKLVQCGNLASKPASFHPKAWRIVDQAGAFIAVGSSNLSRPALETGIEWNLLYSSQDHIGVPDDFAREFDLLWHASADLTSQLVQQYEAASRDFRQRHFEPESIDDPIIPEPRPWQLVALESLRRIRESGYTRALVAVATGMGKTWLAAFDVRQLGQLMGRRPRVLVIAHRSQILAQAESALSLLLDTTFGDGKSSWYIGEQSDLSGELVIASIQKLARPEGLVRIANEKFDYVLIDEVHHAEAPSYRRVMSHLDCGFILGLTATPERTDGVDVASIFDDNLAHHATIGDGIAEDSLVPFHYIGLKDTVDFRQIPWRNGRFEFEELERRVEDSQRMQRLWSAMQEHPAERSIVFCVSRRHAIFARDWLRAKGMSVAAVFSGSGGDSCGQSLELLRSGRLQALCVVDMFNEGLDIPSVDRVIMLRPTESKVIFLQQLGRGLRAAEGKSRLLVIDFVGNHRIFAQRIIHLLSLTGKDASWTKLKEVLEGQPPELPEGCLLDIELAARDLLKQFIPIGPQVGLEVYRTMRDELGRRPTPSEIFARGLLPRTICQAEGSWFDFVEHEGDLMPSEREVLEHFRPWLKTVETTNLNKSYKMIVLRVLLDQQKFLGRVKLNEFSIQCRRSLLGHPVLRRDLIEGNHAIDHLHASDEEWTEWWIQWPIDRWLDQQNGQRWFRRDDDNFESTIDCPTDLSGPLEAMTAELVDWRLAAYAKSRALSATATGDVSIEAKVSHSSGRPMLFLPDVTKAPGRPVGPTTVLLPDGDEWEFKFVKVACNIARPVGSDSNDLPALLRRWFGKNAGVPGTDFRVRFEKTAEQWRIIPVAFDSPPQSANPATVAPIEANTYELTIEANVEIAKQYRTHAPVYDLVAAAGAWGDQGIPEPIGWTPIKNRTLSKGMFVAQVVGRSMEPKIPSGSWCLFRPAPTGSRNNKLVLVQLNTHIDPEAGGRYTVKRYYSTKQVSDDGWQHETVELQPLNSEFIPIQLCTEDTSDVRIIGEFDSVIS